MKRRMGDDCLDPGMPVNESSTVAPKTGVGQALELHSSGPVEGGARMRLVRFFICLVLFCGCMLLVAGGVVGFWGAACPMTLLAGVFAFRTQGLERVAYCLRFGRSRASITPAEIQPGVPFTFQYEQRMRLAIRTEVALALVAREIVVIPSSNGQITEHRDRPIESRGATRVTCGAGKSFVVTEELRVPATGSAGLGLWGREVKWVVKVRLMPRRGLDLWQEFELPRVPDPEPTGSRAVAAAEDNPYSIWLVSERPTMAGMLLRTKEYDRVIAAIQLVRPHLTPFHASSLMWETPAQIAGDLTADEAESARARLEAVGAVVEVRRGDQVIPAPSGRRYPIPHSQPGGCSDSLPRPSEGITSDE